MFDILDPKQLNLTGRFENQVNQLLQCVRLSRNEVQRLRHLFVDLEETLKEAWPGCCVMPFGSIITGLGIQTSDVDCYIDIPDMFKRPGDKYVGIAKQLLNRYPRLYQKVFAIFGAKVPIVKFYHQPTQRQCDISFKSCSGVRNSQLLAFLLNSDNRAHYLAILIKYWAKVHNLTGTNIMSNYTLTMLVIFFLQQKNIVPPISLLQHNVDEYLVDGWNTAFEECTLNQELSHEPLYHLLGGFFKYYSDFDFSKCIVAPFAGYPILRESFLGLNKVPDCYELYKCKVSRKFCTPLKLDAPICVQDPFEHNRNCAAATPLRIAKQFTMHLKFAAKSYETVDECNFLKVILETLPQTDNVNNVSRKKNQNNKVTKNKPKQNSTKRRNLNNYIFKLYENIRARNNNFRY